HHSSSRWFLFFALISATHTYLIVNIFLLGGQHEYLLRFLFLSLLMSFVVIAEKLLTIYHLYKIMPSHPSRKQNEGDLPYNKRVERAIEQRRKFKCELCLLVFFIPFYIGMIVSNVLLLRNEQCSAVRNRHNEIPKDCFGPLL
ncbi:hypothetical protein PMAYCL1PPCAC_02951, partial [Pristionchus mayeri]